MRLGRFIRSVGACPPSAVGHPAQGTITSLSSIRALTPQSVERSPGIGQRLREVPPGLLVAAVATVLAFIVTMPVAVHFGSDIYGTPGDATGGVSQFWWWGYALTHGQSVLDNRLQGVPLGSGWSELPFVVLPLAIFTVLSAIAGPVASYNTLVLTSFPLTAWATYRLARRLSMPELASGFTGLAFAFTPYHIEKAQGHAYQTHMEFIALTLMFLVMWRSSLRGRHAVFAGAMFGLQLWTDYSLAYILTLAVAVFFVVSFALPSAGMSRLAWLKHHLVGGLVVAGLTALFVPLMILFAHRPGAGAYGTSFTGTLQHVNRNFSDLATFSARLHEYVTPWHANPLLPEGVRRWEQANLHGSNWTESSLFLGYTLIALALLGMARTRKAFEVALAIVMVVVGVAVAEPPVAHPFGITVKTPAYYAFHFISFFRVYARFAILVSLGTALLAGAGFAVIEGRLRGTPARLMLALPFLLLAVEFNNQPPHHTTAIFPAPAEYAWLRSQPQGVLLEYPANSGPPPVQEVEIRQYELYQMVHLHPTFLNEIAGSGPVAAAAADLEPYYKPGVVEEMRRYGIRYVFVHRRDYVDAGWKVPTDVAGLTKVATIDGVDIYTVDGIG